MYLQIDQIKDLPARVQAQIRNELQGKPQSEFSPAEISRRKDPSCGKYRNKKTESKGITFDSAKESRRYDELIMRQRAGEIENLRLQVDFTLQEAYTDCNGNRVRAIRYKGDFSYIENGRLVVEDVKSRATKTSTYMIKKKMMKERFGIDIKEV